MMKTENDTATRAAGWAQNATEGAGSAGNGPGSAPATSPAGDLPEDLATAYRKLLAEKQELYDRLLRKQAELENIRKRTEREKEDFLKHATADLIRALLPALDSFERALKHRNPNVPEEFYRGVELIYGELVEVLRRAGLDPLQTLGATFDPHLHQAVETVESAEHRPHEVVEELQRGYKLKQRLLRPAVVKVAVAPKSDSGQVEKANNGGS
jgi:molecular chaperone GrpE